MSRTTEGDSVDEERQTLAERLAKEVWDKRVAGLPEEVVRHTAVRVVDTIGVALAGATSPPGMAAAAVAAGAPGAEGERSTIWATGRRARAADAAFANSAAAHALDYDDGGADTVTHTGSIAVPVALAMAEQLGSTARAALSAIVCGYQVAEFVERLSHHEFQANGFQSAAIAGLFGGVTTAASMAELEPAALADAFGIAGSMASGLMEFLIAGGDTKPIQVGWAAHSAIVATQLASLGMRGPRSVLEGRYGLYNSYLRRQLDEAVVQDEPVWSRYAVMRAASKPYPTCLGIHAAADAWMELAGRVRAAGGDPSRDVRSIHCEVPPFSARLVLDPIEVKRRPNSSHEARFSLPYCLARIAIDGRLGLGSFEDHMLDDAEALSFMDRVTYSLLPSGDTRAVVRADCGGYGMLEKAIGPQSGEPHEWMTEEQLHAKFLDAGAGLGSEPELEDLYRTASEIYETDDLRPLVSLLGALGARATA